MAERIFGQAVNPQVRQPEPLSPAPLQSSTFVQAPVQRDAGRNAMMLADALGNLNRSLSRYGSVMAAKRNDPNSEAEERFRASMEGKSAEELRSYLIENKDLPWVREKAVGGLLGQRVAADAILQWTEYARTKKAEGADIGTELEIFRQGMMDQLPSDAARQAFWRATEPWAQQIQGQYMKERVDTAIYERDQSIIAGIKTNSDAMIAKGATADEIVSSMFEQNETNKAFFDLTPEQQNEIMIGVAGYYADLGRPDIVEKLITTPRPGGGSRLGDTPGFTDKARDLIDRAQDVHDRDTAEKNWGARVEVDELVRRGAFNKKEAEAFAEQHPEFSKQWIASQIDQSERQRAANIAAIKRADAKRLALHNHTTAKENAFAAAFERTQRFGGADDITDTVIPTKEGDGTTTLTRQNIMDEVIKRHDAALAIKADQMRRTGASEEQVTAAIFAEKLKWASANKIAIPEWERKLSNVAMQASPALMDGEKGEIPKELAESVELYRAIHNVNPTLARSLVKDEQSRKLYDAYMQNIDLYGSGGEANKDHELRRAVEFANRTPAQQEASQITVKEARDILDEVQDDGKWFSVRFPGWVPNDADTARVLERMRTISGINPHLPRDEIAKQAIKWVQDNSIEVNGRLLDATRSGMPQDFGLLAESILDDIAHVSDDDSITDGSQLSLVETTTPGRYQVVLAANNSALDQPTFVTINSINQKRKQNAQYAEREAAAWGMTKEQMGIHEFTYKFQPGARIRVGIQRLAGGGVKPEDITDEQATAYLTNLRRQKEIEALVEGKASQQGMRLIQYQGGPAWVNTHTNELQELTVNWSDKGEKTVTWTGIGKKVSGPKTTYRKSIWLNRGITFLPRGGKERKLRRPAAEDQMPLMP